MYDMISNVASIVTCVAFLLYILGHIFIMIKDKHTVYEKFKTIPYMSDIDIEDEDNCLIVDNNGCSFIIESEYGIKNITIYKVDYELGKKGKLKLKDRKQITSFCNLNQEKLYIRCDLGELIPTKQFRIKRSDYSVVTLELYESGKNGHINVCSYNSRITLKSFLYHLCV